MNKLQKAMTIKKFNVNSKHLEFDKIGDVV